MEKLDKELVLMSNIRSFLVSKGFLERIDLNNKNKAVNTVGDAIRYITINRSCDGINEFLDRKYHSYSKYEEITDFMVEEQGKSRDVVNLMIRENAIRSGLLFHGTNTSNLNGIVKNGLCSLSSMYGPEFEAEVNKINRLYQMVYERASMGGRSIMNVNPLFISEFEHDRCDAIYLTAAFDIAQIYASNSGEWLRMYYKRLLSNFGCDELNIDWKNKEKLKKRLSESLKSTGCLFNGEIKCFVDFFDKYYSRYGYDDSIYNQSIIMVPKNAQGMQVDFDCLAAMNEEFGIVVEPDQIKCSKSIPTKQLTILSFDRLSKIRIR